MPGPSRYNRKLKARNDRRQAASGGGRTPSEAGLGKSMAASGYRVSKTNTTASAPRPRRARAPKAPKASQAPGPKVGQGAERAIQNLRRKYGLERPTPKAAKNQRVEDEIENAILRKEPTRPEAMAISDQVRKGTEVSVGGQVLKVAGKKPVGNPSAKSVKKAAKKGKLRNRGDRFTTPQVRRVERKVKKASRKLIKAQRRASMSGGIEGPLTPGQKKFAKIFSKKTGINPRVAGAWLLSEMSDSAAQGREAEGNHNWLNIAYFDSGPGSITKDRVWSNPRSAANASARFLKGKQFGASEGIQAILPQARGRSDEAQIQAIAGSGWASSGYEGGDSLRRTRELISTRPADPKAKAKLDRVKGVAEEVDREARKLGLPGVAGLSPDGKAAVEDVFRIKKEKGILAGSRKMVSKVIGQPVWGDKEPGHSAGGDHDPSIGDAYAQDIQLGADNPAEGEPTYDQALLDRIEKNIRKMGGEVGDLKVGSGMNEAFVQGYRLQIIADSATNYHGSGPHLHIGAKWTGEKPPPGTQFGGGGSGTVSVPGGGSGGGVTTSGGSPEQLRAGGKGKGKESVKDILRELGYNVTSTGITKTGILADTTPEATTTTTSSLKRRYGVK